MRQINYVDDKFPINLGQKDKGVITDDQEEFYKQQTTLLDGAQTNIVTNEF